MRRRHEMPFGAHLLPEGGVRFRLWAPGAREVSLGLEDEATRALLAMRPQPGGWFDLAVERARPGSRYRFHVDGGAGVPDPASRFNPEDVHGPSEVIDPHAFVWQDDDWRGRPWEEAVLYELHVGCFSPEGTFAGVQKRLDHLAELGVTALELMPVADFPGARNWGYDGVLPYAPDSRYGRPEDLKRLVQAAHARGLMVFMDVVYNHFGPEGNYLHGYAPDFFNPRHATPWGAAINFDAEGSRTVRDFFIHNALYWLTEYHLDGLRLDAVHAIADDSRPDILDELALAVRAGPGKARPVHLVLENDDNAARYLRRTADGTPVYDAQWNDDIHHALHVLVTGETDGYYADYAAAPLAQLGRCLAEGFAFQGERSAYRERLRGEPSRPLAASVCVNFTQTHDQVGNRAFGERLAALAQPAALEAATAAVLLAPAPPMLFMGEEFACAQPFLFFCDFGPDLAQAVTEGRRGEFARFARFSDPHAREAIPDPNDPATFERSRLDWACLEQPRHAHWLALYRRLLALRAQWIAPRLPGTRYADAGYEVIGEALLRCRWRLGDGSRLSLLANFSNAAAGGLARPEGRLLWASGKEAEDLLGSDRLPAWSVLWYLAAVGPA